MSQPREGTAGEVKEGARAGAGKETRGGRKVDRCGKDPTDRKLFQVKDAQACPAAVPKGHHGKGKVRMQRREEMSWREGLSPTGAEWGPGKWSLPRDGGSNFHLTESEGNSGRGCSHRDLRVTPPRLRGRGARPGALCLPRSTVISKVFL